MTKNNAFEKLLLTAKLLRQHVESDLVDHHIAAGKRAETYQSPMWLIDCMEDIQDAQAALDTRPTPPTQIDLGELKKIMREKYCAELQVSCSHVGTVMDVTLDHLAHIYPDLFGKGVGMKIKSEKQRLAQQLKNLVGLARMGSASLGKYEAALKDAEELLLEVGEIEPPVVWPCGCQWDEDTGFSICAECSDLECFQSPEPTPLLEVFENGDMNLKSSGGIYEYRFNSSAIRRITNALKKYDCWKGSNQ